MIKLFRAAAAAIALLAAALLAGALPADAGAAFDLVASPPAGDAQLDGVAAAPDGRAWAVGERTATGTLALRWNGRRWRVASTPLATTPFASLADASFVRHGGVWAVGATGGDEALVLHNLGHGWKRVSAPQAAGGQNALSGVDARSPDDVWAVGSRTDVSAAATRTLIEHWDGLRWHIVPSPNPSSGTGSALIQNDLTAVDAQAADDVWAVGSFFDNTDNVTRPLTLHYDGTRWTRVDAPGTPSLNGVLARRGEAWAVGSDGSRAGALLHWDGDAWSAVPTPTLTGCPTDVQLFDVAGLSGGGAISVGTCRAQSPLDGDRSGRTVAEVWDGDSWTRIPTESPAETGENELRSVARVPGASAIWAVGEHGLGEGTPAHTLVERQR